MNFIDSIRVNPGDWRLNEYTFDHKDGTKIWVSNGFSHYRLWPGHSVWSYSTKRKFHRAFRRWCENKQV